jgi:hypothetical protein
MAGEINGTSVLVSRTSGTIIGQMEMTMTVGGTPIDISNKSYGSFVTYLDDELSARQLVLSGTIVYNSDTVYRAVRADALTGSQDDYTITYPSGETFTAKFVPTGMSDALPHGDKVSTTISFNSSGAYTHTPAS